MFSLAAPIVYVVCELLSLPLFTYHPATNRVDFGWAPGRSGEGPAMYWYGWVATMLIGCTVLGWLATLLPERVIKKIPLALIWLLPILAIDPAGLGADAVLDQGMTAVRHAVGKDVTGAEN